MIKTYKLKLFPNKTKEIELNKLIAYWRDQVNGQCGYEQNADIVGAMNIAGRVVTELRSEINGARVAFGR